MSDFAKIERADDGAMVLFLQEISDVDGMPTVYTMTAHDGITAKQGIAFADDDEGWAAQQRYYDKLGKTEANAFRQRVKEVMAN